MTNKNVKFDLDPAEMSDQDLRNNLLSCELFQHSPEFIKRSLSNFYRPKMSEQTKRKISSSLKGRPNLTLKETHRKLKADGKTISKVIQKGYKLSEEHKQNISKSRQGIEPWNKGIKNFLNRPHPFKGKSLKPLSEEHKKALHASRKGQKNKKQICCNCGGLFAVTAINRFHNDNCLLNKQNERSVEIVNAITPYLHLKPYEIKNEVLKNGLLKQYKEQTITCYAKKLKEMLNK